MNTDEGIVANSVQAAPDQRAAIHAMLGQVAVLYLRLRLSESGDGETTAEGTARFAIDRLSPAETAAIARAILSDPVLSRLVEIKLPSTWVAGFDLPAEVLTTERATYHRNAPCSRPALLLVDTGDDEDQSLRDLPKIGTADLLARPDLWVQVAGQDVELLDEHRRWWERALAGLQSVDRTSLERFGAYVLRVRDFVDSEGLPIVHALGAALPALCIPRDSDYFKALPDRYRTHMSRWKAQYSSAYGKRASYLAKQTPSGVVLSEDDLSKAFERVRQDIPEPLHGVVLEFIAAPTGWNSASAQLAEQEWADIHYLFDGLAKEKVSLGQATLDFYDFHNPELLTEDDRDYLTRLALRKATDVGDEDREFYESHLQDLRQDRKLRSLWDRFIFGTAKETPDFIAGLAACLEGFNWDLAATKRRLVIRCESRQPKDFHDLNVDAGLYFAQRYKGLPELLGSLVEWHVGRLFEFPDLVEEWRLRKIELNRSESRSATQLKFYVELHVDTAVGSSEAMLRTQLVWRFDPRWVTNEFPHDIRRLSSHPLVLCRVSREPSTAKASGDIVDLEDVRSLLPAYDRDRGSFVGMYRPGNDLTKIWPERLQEAVARGYVSTEAARTLSGLFNAFADAYAQAVREFRTKGVAAQDAVEDQAEAYGALLEQLCSAARTDRNRQLLMRPLMELGTAAVDGGRPAAIVVPWHPLRLTALTRKARRVADLVRQLLNTSELDFADARLFFHDLQDQLAHPYYPEVVLGWQGEQPELLALTDSTGDYSLHECPLSNDAASDETNENPAEGAARVVELVQRYLALQPHERANLSVVLYNSDSARLPVAVVEKLGGLQQDDEDARCRVVLRHRDPRRLRRLYEQIMEGTDGDGDAFIASETTRNFMARLRIGIMADQAPAPDPRDGQPEDIVFSQDVVARHAHLEWYLEDAPSLAPSQLNPAQWSRRRPAAMGDMRSVTYLCCPAQTAEGWSFLTAIATFFQGDWNEDRARRFLPARQLNFQDSKTSEIFEETHNLGAWVANYDELLDRRQLLEHDVRIIRYKQMATQGRNLIISSRAPIGLLRSMVVRRLRDLNLDLDPHELMELADRFIADANDLSGDIVLRAARRGRSASELMGLVLSRFVIRHEFGPERYAGWYFLDDYASWLGQREEQIADLLALCPVETPDGKVLLAVVTEAKYVDASVLSAKRRESQKQLRDTVRRISGAVGGDAARLDRDVWLARLSDMLVDGVRFPIGRELNLAEWRHAIRDGRCPVEVHGYSHVFVSGPAGAPDHSEVAAIPDVGEVLYSAVQEIFGVDRVRELVRRYKEGQDPLTVRTGDGAGPDNQQPGAARALTVPLTTDAIARVSRAQETRNGGAQKRTSDADDSTVGTPTGEPGQAFVGPTPSPDPEREGRQPDDVEVEAADDHWSYPGIARWANSGIESHANNAEDAGWLRQVESATKLALQSFQLQAKLLSSTLTPNAALLKFQGSASLTVDQVLRHQKEFLTTYSLDLISVRPEPGMVALSIARPRRQLVTLKELWRRWTPDISNGNRNLLIGIREDDGSLLILSPGGEHAPHTLIAGQTGSGKSVLMQNVILSIAATNTPAQAQITLIDPKQGVDYFAFEDLPHLQGGIIDSQDVALRHLEDLVTEMDARYGRMRQARAVNLQVYNAKVPPNEQLPTLWLIHDEFAEWMLIEEYKQHVASAVQRLGVKARAAGIHLVFAAQRPDANVMPMQLRSNLGNRLILRVDSEGTSELALGEKGAERLLGKGHLLARLENSPSLIYAQVPYAQPADIDELVALIDRAAGEMR